ncbi:carbohydrate porin [Novosphingobium profundi]|uniref:carbohydrate porin n=1 Tax=Novosphingobium profundi TaxID=1774954 RepID=UPI001CFDCDD1|nr:carbohydrate porin [Novosphingobium profundi]
MIVGVTIRLFATLALSSPLLAQPARSQDTADPAPSLAAALDIAGVNPRLDLTGFVEARAAGDGDSDAQFTIRGDLYTDFASDGLGLWRGTLLRTHLEWREGDSAGLGRGGALLPTNTGAFLPLSGKGPELTSLYVLQKMGPTTNLIVGKVNAVDLLDSDPFFGGMGNRRFKSIVFVAPPSGVVPPVLMGGILTHQVGDVGLTAMVFDPNDRSDDYWIDGLFATGVNLSFGGTWSGGIDGRPSSIGVTGTVSTKRGSDFKDILLPPGFERSTRNGSFNIAVQVSHLLAQSQADPAKGLGLYAKAAIADGNPNVIQSSFIVGLAGHAMIAGREADSFGIGAFYYNFSDVLQDTTVSLIDIDDEKGFEAWYNFALNRNFILGADMQLIDPASGERDTAFIIGMRLGATF